MKFEDGIFYMKYLSKFFTKGYSAVVLNWGYTYPLVVRSTKTGGTKQQIVSEIHVLKM